MGKLAGLSHLEQQLQKGVRLLGLQSDDSLREAGVDEEELLAGSLEIVC